MLPYRMTDYNRQKVPYFLSENVGQSCFQRGFCIIIHLLTRRPLHRGDEVNDATGA